MKIKSLLFLGALACLSFVSVIFLNQAASFKAYAPKLLKFEGEGYGIHKPIWGDKEFTKDEALAIHRHHYWNKFKGPQFKSQQVAEVFIDHIINAGAGRNNVNIKAFQRIVGVQEDGILSVADIEAANGYEFPHEIVNAYVDYRLSYYKTRKDWRKYPGWFTRAKSFYIPIPANYHQEIASESSVETPDDKQEQQFNIIEDIDSEPRASSSNSTTFQNGMVIEEYVVRPKK